MTTSVRAALWGKDAQVVTERSSQGSGQAPMDPALRPEANAREEDEEEIEEALAVKPARNPGAPTAAEKEAHEATHLPFRSWCAECVAGRRDNPPHRKRQDEERSVPEIFLDYAFVRREDETKTATILLMKDRESRAIRASVMRSKGTCQEEAVDCSGRDQGIRAQVQDHHQDGQ